MSTKVDVIKELDPRVKVIATLLIVGALITARSWRSYSIVLCSVLLFAFLGNVTYQRLWRAVRGITVLLLLTFILNMLFTPGNIVFQIGPLAVTAEGIVRGLSYSLTLILLVALTTILTETTEPLDLADGVQFLMSPLKLIGVPTPEIAVVTSISLRFVPILFEEARRIAAAQFARGVDSRTASPLQRVTSVSAILIPLFFGALRRADELGDALEARGFRPGMRRGNLYPIKPGIRDVLALGFCVFILVVATVW